LIDGDAEEYYSSDEDDVAFAMELYYTDAENNKEQQFAL
jgi:hypothetical protein